MSILIDNQPNYERKRITRCVWRQNHCGLSLGGLPTLIISLSVTISVDVVYSLLLSVSKVVTVKPIFYQNEKLLASGNLASPDAKDSTFASPDARIPTCWYLLR